VKPIFRVTGAKQNEQGLLYWILSISTKTLTINMVLFHYRTSQGIFMTDEELRDWAIAQQIKHLEAARTESIMFRLDGPVKTKARPRTNFETETVYMPQDYMEWKENAAKLLNCLQRQYPQYHFPLLQANIMYIFDGKHNRGQDGDNAGGSCADALVDAQILKGDNFMKIPEQCMFLNHHQKRSPSTLIVLY